VENAPRSPLPPLPLPEPMEPSSMPTLCIYTAELSPPSSKNSAPAGSSRSPIRPLPTPPTRPQVRRQRSSKAEEALRESSRGPLPHRKFSDDDVRHGSRQSTAHSETSEVDGAQHHDEAWSDFPPPYSESLPAQGIIPSTSQYTV
jgi:hypothetical protein